VLTRYPQFYKGPEPTGNEAPVDPRSEYCESLEQQLALKRASLLQQSGSQVRLGGASISEADLHPLPHLLASNCAPPAASLAAEHFSTDVDASMPQALLRFMLEAAPDAVLADDVTANFARYRDALRPTPAAQILGTGASYYELADVPGTVSPVKARLAYVQVPQGEETVLSLVWKVCTLHASLCDVC
jgi:extracellular elastinolytic metalloproteinase